MRHYLLWILTATFSKKKLHPHFDPGCIYTLLLSIVAIGFRQDFVSDQNIFSFYLTRRKATYFYMYIESYFNQTFF